MTSNSSIDEAWFGRLKSIIRELPETFVLLYPTLDDAKQLQKEFFSSNETANPNLIPSRLNEVMLQDIYVKLQQLHADISAQEENEWVKEAYTARIEELLSNINMVVASIRGDVQVFMKENTSLYGYPDSQFFAAVCAWIREDIESTTVGDNYELAALRGAALKIVPDALGDSTLILPDKTAFNKVRDLHFRRGGYFDRLFGEGKLPQQPYVEQEVGDEICQRVLRNIGADYTLADSDNGLWSVLQNQRVVVRPPGYRLDRDEFIGVVAHEIGSHVIESANGGRSRLKLLEIGLDKFETGTEGRAFLREQIVYESEASFIRQSPWWEYIIMLHLAVCLSVGLNKKPYTFVELYRVLYALHAFWRQRRYPFTTNNDAFAREQAWLLAVRIMKGTDGTGGAYMKDIVYLEGNKRCWDIAKTDPELILQGDTGKFDIGNPRHLAILQGLGILPRRF